MAAQTMVYHSGVVNQGILISMRCRFFYLLFLFPVIANSAYPQSAGGPVQGNGNDEALTVVSTIWPLHLAQLLFGETKFLQLPVIMVSSPGLGTTLMFTG